MMSLLGALLASNVIYGDAGMTTFKTPTTVCPILAIREYKYDCLCVQLVFV